MKTGIVGAGALGSLFAHYFHEHLINAVIYEKDADTVSRITDEGLTLIRGESRKTIRPVIDSTPEILSESEIIFLFVKSYSTASAVNDIVPFIKKDAFIVSLQNGLGNIEIIREHFEPERIVYGTTTIGAAKDSASTVISGGTGIINIGGTGEGQVIKTEHLLNRAGLNPYTVADPDYYLWHKAIINAGINPIAMILGITNGDILKNSHAMKLQENIIREAVDSAAANNVKIELSEILKTTRDVCEKTSINVCSMLQDLRNRRKTEIDSITGYLIEHGTKHGVPMPYNTAIFMLIKSIESRYLDMQI